MYGFASSVISQVIGIVTVWLGIKKNVRMRFRSKKNNMLGSTETENSPYLHRASALGKQSYDCHTHANSGVHIRVLFFCYEHYDGKKFYLIVFSTNEIHAVRMRTVSLFLTLL